MQELWARTMIYKSRYVKKIVIPDEKTYPKMGSELLRLLWQTSDELAILEQIL